MKPSNIHKLRLPLLVILALFTLSCNLVTRAVFPATATPIPSATPVPTSTATALPTFTPEPTQPAVYIPEDCQGQPVATIPAATVVAEPTPSLEKNPEISPEMQLVVFEQLVNTINKVYLYPDFNGVDWKGIVASYRAKVKAGLDTEAFYDLMMRFVFELKDEHSQFQSPVVIKAAEAELSGHMDFVGIGITAMAMPEKKLATVLSIFPDSPAEHAGLKIHDSILATDGMPIVEGDKVYMSRVRGPQCSSVTLTIQSPGGQPRDVLIMRHRITTDLPVNAQLVKTSDGSRIGYIYLPTFFDETIPGSVKTALENFGDLDGLILDNRMNSGGSSDVVEPILGYFTKGRLGQFISRDKKVPFEVQADPINNSQTVPLVVLVGLDTASFGEIFAGTLQDTGRAKVAGQTTNGNVEILYSYDFKDGSQAWIAHSRFDPRVSHADWEKTGIIPDEQGYADWDTFTFDTDPGIAAALKLLGHQ